MNNKQQRLLIKMKKLIRENKKRFSTRKDRDYLEDLLEIGITEEEAWNIILQLNSNFYFNDPKPIYSRGEDSLTFKRIINGKNVYIKLILEKLTNEIVTCLSFHIDNKR